MLTLKVVTTDSEGEHQTHLFYGERISHKETESDNHTSDLKSCLEKNEVVIDTSDLTATPNSKQLYSKSRVYIYGEGETPKTLLWILPCAICYIMHEGKTIDTFSARFNN